MGRMAKAYPDFMPASAEARRKILELYGARAEAEIPPGNRIPPGDFRTVNELRRVHGFGPLSQLSPALDDLSDRTGANRHTAE